MSDSIHETPGFTADDLHAYATGIRDTIKESIVAQLEHTKPMIADGGQMVVHSTKPYEAITFAVKALQQSNDLVARLMVMKSGDGGVLYLEDDKLTPDQIASMTAVEFAKARREGRV